MVKLFREMWITFVKPLNLFLTSVSEIIIFVPRKLGRHTKRVDNCRAS